MTNEKTIEEYVKLAEHYLAIGQEEIHLIEPQKDLPWGDVIRVETGGTYRLGIATNLRITAAHPCGLKFVWYFDLEGRDAFGRPVNLLNELSLQLPTRTRDMIGEVLQGEILPGLKRRAEEINEELLNQLALKAAMELVLEMLEKGAKSK